MASIDPSSPPDENDSAIEDVTPQGEPPRPAAAPAVEAMTPAAAPGATIPAPPPTAPTSSAPILALSDGTLVEEDEPTAKHALVEDAKPKS